MTAVLICSLCLLISTSISIYHVTSLFLVLSTLNTSNNLFMSFILIFSSFTTCLSIPVWVHPEFTSICSHNFFSFDVLMFVYMFNSLFLLFLWFRITYQFWELLFTVLHTVPTLDLCQNSSVCHPSYYLFLLEYCSSSSYVLIYNIWQYALLCCTCNTF